MMALIPYTIYYAQTYLDKIYNNDMHIIVTFLVKVEF